MLNIRIIIGFIIGFILLVIVGLCAWHYHGMIEEAKTLQNNNTKLEIAVQTQNDTINQMGAAIVGWKKAQENLLSTMKAINAEARKAREAAKRTEELFARHDFAALALRKPELIEQRINRATASALHGLECASGQSGCQP